MDDTIDLLQIRIEKAKAQLSEDTLNAIAAVPWQAAILKMRETKGYSFEQLGDLELETELLLCGLLSPEDYPRELESRMKINKAQTNELVNEMNSLVFSKIKEELIKKTERKKIFAPTLQGAGLPISDTYGQNIGAKKQIFSDSAKEKNNNMQVLSSAGIEIINGNGKPARADGEKLPVPEKLELPAKPIIEAIAESKGWEKSKPAATPALEQKKEEMHPMLSQKLSGSFQIPSVKTEHTLDNITKTNPPASLNEKVDKPYLDPYREMPE